VTAGRAIALKARVMTPLFSVCSRQHRQFDIDWAMWVRH
jgi:hypothetical protein